MSARLAAALAAGLVAAILAGIVDAKESGGPSTDPTGSYHQSGGGGGGDQSSPRSRESLVAADAGNRKFGSLRAPSTSAKERKAADPTDFGHGRLFSRVRNDGAKGASQSPVVLALAVVAAGLGALGGLLGVLVLGLRNRKSRWARRHR